MRVWAPTPRVQVIRDAPEHRLDTLDGVPIWHTPLQDALTAATCSPGAPDDAPLAVFAGDSIFYTSGSNVPEAVFTTQVPALTDTPWCVRNVSRPAFAGPQKAAVAVDALRRWSPDLLVYGVWNEESHYVRAGDVLYETSRLHRDATGVPFVPSWPVPPPVHRALFFGSALWRYATLALSVRDDLGPGDPVVRQRQPMERVLRAAAEAGVPVVAVQLPRLDRPFAEAAAHPKVETSRVVDHAARFGAVPFVLAEALRDEDVADLRLDRCCHYDDAGHRVLATTFAARLDPWAAAAPPQAPPVDTP